MEQKQYKTECTFLWLFKTCCHKNAKKKKKILNVNDHSGGILMWTNLNATVGFTVETNKILLPH